MFRPAVKVPERKKRNAGCTENERVGRVGGCARGRGKAPRVVVVELRFGRVIATVGTPPDGLRALALLAHYTHVRMSLLAHRNQAKIRRHRKCKSNGCEVAKDSKQANIPISQA